MQPSPGKQTARTGRARLADRLPGQPATGRLELLNRIALQLATTETVAQTFQATVTLMAQALPLASVILLEESGDAMRTTNWLAPGQTLATLDGASAHAGTAFAYLTGAASRNEGPRASNPEPRAESPESAGNRRFIVLPLVVAARPVFGVIQVEADAFEKQDLLFISAVANQLAVALDRDRSWRREIVRRDHAEVMEVTLRGQADALLEADRQRSAFLSVLADELRSSLAVFREIQQSFRAISGNERTDRAVRMLSGQIQQTAQLIDDLHGLSSLSREVVQLSKQRIEIGEILAQAAKQGAERLGARGQTLTVSLPTTRAYLEADASRLQQVFDTLIDKASALVSPGGRIWLTARLSSGTGDGATGLRGPQLRVTLRDDGAGDVKSILPRVFDLFHPSERQLDGADASAGAGLKLMRRIVELHGGVASATSSGFGQGSEFEVRLPIGSAVMQELRAEQRSS